MAGRVAQAVDACVNCERCTWNPGDDCGLREHPHCERCDHCRYRHVSGEDWGEFLDPDYDWDA